MDIIGVSVPRIDAVDKVTGRAAYVGDLEVSGMLHGKILRSPLPHAEVREIDTSEALKLPGVVAVLTRDDLKGWTPSTARWCGTGLSSPRTRSAIRESRWPPWPPWTGPPRKRPWN